MERIALRSMSIRCFGFGSHVALYANDGRVKPPVRKWTPILKIVGQRNTVPAPPEGNIILMGSPGCGKTTVGAILSRRLGVPHVDVDDDHLEPYWATTVANKLKELGDERFLIEEGKVLEQLEVSNSVISLTGSNPLNQQSMTKLKKTGTVVFLDVRIEDILSRLREMKVDRIVGHGGKTSLDDIIVYRQQFYERFYDLRIICQDRESCESIAGKVLVRVEEFKNGRKYISSRSLSNLDSEAALKTFSQVTLQGFSQDGGLFVPAYEIPSLTLGEWNRILPLKYSSRAHRILEQWLPTNEIASGTMDEFVSKAYDSGSFADSQVCPVRHLSGNQYVVELFHGPTASFKDFALHLMPQFFDKALQDTHQRMDNGRINEKRVILVATSGDTGGAVLDGFLRHAAKSGVGVIVLYPLHGVSAIQKTQMTSMDGPGIAVIGVESDFDFCQSSIKQISNDTQIVKKLYQEHNCKLSAANSINWARLLPQVVYHASAYLDLVQNKVIAMGEGVDYCIPTGNFGSILAAYYAKKMGIPFRRLICASNANNVLSRFIRTGRYDISSQPLRLTMSPAIDILRSSNLERYLWEASGRSGSLMRELYSSLDKHGYFESPIDLQMKICEDFQAGWCTEEDCSSEIQKTFNYNKYLLDPHTAVAKVVADSFNSGERPMLIAATAHYAKFADVVLSSIAVDSLRTKKSPIELLRKLGDLNPIPPMHTNLRKSLERPIIHDTVCRASVTEIVDRINSFVGQL